MSKIIVQTWPNKAIRTFHVRGLIGSVLAHIKLIDGVTACSARDYSMSIEKAECYTWDELQPLIAKAIEGIHYGCSAEIEVRDGMDLAVNG